MTRVHSIFVAMLLLSCAGAQREAKDPRALPLCAPGPMELPQSVRDGSRSGLVGVEYDEDGEGVALHFQPLPNFPGAGSPLYDELVAELASCRWPPEGRALHHERVFSLAPAPHPDLAPEIIDDQALVAAHGSLPSSKSCEPEEPPVSLPELTGYVVHSNGVASDPMFVFKDEVEQQRIQDAEPVVRAWLAACRFAPARNAANDPVTVRVHRDSASTARTTEGIKSGELTRPAPRCGTRPIAPAAARENGISGMVLVAYRVREDGSTSVPILLNPNAPRILYRAVREWLESCRFEPARKKDGTPVAARMIQPFSFNGVR